MSPRIIVKAGSFPARVLSLALLLTAAVLIGVAGMAIDSYRDIAARQARDLRLERLRGVILRLDEVLTMSARMAAGTGDRAYEARYRQFEPQLDAAVREAAALAARTAVATATAETDAANAQLVAMEHQAFALVAAGRTADAQALLLSPEYEAQKRHYAQGMETLIHRLEQELVENLRAKRAHALLAVVLVVASIVLLLVTWVSVLRRLNRWRVAQVASVAALKQAEEALAAAYANLEKRVAERTNDLTRQITERARVEEALRHKQAQIQAMHDASPLGMFVCEAGGVCRYANRVFIEFTGRSLAELSMQPWLQIAHAGQVDQLAREWAQATAAAVPFTAVVRVQRRDGSETWASVKAAPMHEHGVVTGYVGTTEDISERRRAEVELQETQQRLLETSHLAGMAEIAAGVLHNVGNVLNSVNVSTTLVADLLHSSELGNLEKVCALLRRHRDDLAAFIVSDPRGQKLPAFLETLAEHLTREQQDILAELALLRKNIEHIKEIVAMQQSYAKLGGAIDTVQLHELVEDAVRMNEAAMARHSVELVRDYQAQPFVTVERHKVLQILVNLLRNAKYACEESPEGEKRIILRLTEENGRVRLAVIDNGVGIPAENFAKLFTHGFTTRAHGHGFGLHSGAQAAKELGGSLTAFSAGPGQGATFTLELPQQSTQGKAA